ncbi:MAG: hypothetical protein R2941_24870 [Desulfobacterales bacterium]
MHGLVPLEHEAHETGLRQGFTGALKSDKLVALSEEDRLRELLYPC